MKFANRSKTGATLKKNSIVLIMLLVVIVFATMAWFTVRKYSEILDVYVGSEDNLSSIYFAIDDGITSYNQLTYSSNLRLTSSSIDRNLNKSITSDGQNFVIPEFDLTSNDNGRLTPDLTKAGSTAVANQDYFSVSFYVRSLNDGLKVSADSFVEAELVDSYNNIVNKSPYGEYSRNGIAGAVRVSLVQEDIDDTNAETLKFLWLPRPDLKFDEANKQLNRVTSGSSFTHSYLQQSGETLEEKSVTPGNNFLIPSGAGLSVDPPVLASDFALGNGKSAVIDSQSYYFYKYTMNVWIEGTDSEAVREFNDGNFRVVLKFKTDDVV